MITENRLNQIIKETVSRLLKENLDYEINDIYNGKMKDSDNPLLNKTWDNGFSLAEMLQTDNPQERIRYASSKLKCLGIGKRRTAFLLNNKYILKLANGTHRFQTKNEYDSASLMTDRNDIFPRLLYQSRDFSWTISERAFSLTNRDCQEILGIPLYSQGHNQPSLEDFQMWAETEARRPSRQSDNKLDMIKDNNCQQIYRNLLKTQPFLKKLLNVERTCRANEDYGTDLNPSGYDFRGENLGYVIRNGKKQIVLLDAGFITPFDTRKLNAKHGIESMQVPNNIKHT